MSFSIKLRTDEYVKRRSVVGPIWLEMDGQPFPIDVWYDFPLIILGFWLENIKPLIANLSATCECPFMDGPYRFELAVQETSNWKVVFIRDELDGEKQILVGSIDPQVIILEMLLAANTVIELCQQRGWEMEDLETLEKTADEVRKLL